MQDETTTSTPQTPAAPVAPSTPPATPDPVPQTPTQTTPPMTPPPAPVNSPEPLVNEPHTGPHLSKILIYVLGAINILLVIYIGFMLISRM